MVVGRGQEKRDTVRQQKKAAVIQTEQAKEDADRRTKEEEQYHAQVSITASAHDQQLE